MTAPILRRRRAVLGVALAGVLAATAPVGAATKTTKKTTTKKPTVTTAAPTTAAPTTAAPSTGPKGTLRMASFTDIPSMDPTRSQLTHMPYLTLVYDTLLRRDADGNLLPGLAVKWSQPDKRTWRFVLRQGVKFTDGSAFDAEAVRSNLDRARKFAGNPQIGVFAGITDIVAVDASTVDVKFAKGNPGFAFEMASVGGMMASPKAGDLTRAPVGTGGWTFDRGASQEGSRYVFVANPGWWDKTNQRYAKVEVSFVADNAARLNALKAGQVDYVDVILSNQVDDAKKAGVKIVTIADQTVPIIIGDRDGKLVPALGKREVRQAMNYAMNRDAYVKAVMDGIGSSESSIYRIDSPWHNKENDNRYAYDKDKAKALLAKAGYPDGFEVSLPTFATIKAATEAFATIMADVGIKVKLVQVAPGTAGAEFRKKTFPLVYGPIAVGDPYTYYGNWISPDSPWNPFGVDNGLFDSLAARALDAPNDAARKVVYRDLEQAIMDEGFYLVMAHGMTISALSKDAKGSPFLYSGERMVRPELVDIPVS